MLMHTRCRVALALALGVSIALPVGAQAPRDSAPQIDHYFRLARAEYSGDRARDLVAFMSNWSRWAGNTAFDASIESD